MFSWTVTIVEGDGGGPGSLSRQAFLASAVLFPTARLLFNDSGDRLNLTIASQRGTVGIGHRTEHIFFIQDNVEVSRSALEHMFDILEQNCRVGLVGSASSKPDGAIFHRGVAFDLGPRHKRCLSSDSYEDDYSYGSSYGSRREGGDGGDGPLAWTSQAIWAFHAGQGLRAPQAQPQRREGARTAASDAADPSETRASVTMVEAITEGCWAIRHRVWRQLGGLDPR